MSRRGKRPSQAVRRVLATWQSFPITTQAKSITFSSIAAGPNGRVAAVYDGSDRAGDPRAGNGGRWSLYVAETSNALARNPVWKETRLVDLVHTGNICASLNCETEGEDPTARFSADYIGSFIDGNGLLHVAYQSDAAGESRAYYIRQLAPNAHRVQTAPRD